MNDSELDALLDAWKAPAVPESLGSGLRSRLGGRPQRPKRWFLAAALAAAALGLGASLAQDADLGGETGAWDNQTFVRRTRMIHPALAALKWIFSGGLSTGWRWQDGNLVGSRYIYDRASRAHYGYTWSARPLSEGRYLFTVYPLDPSVLKEDGPIVPLPHPPAPTILTAGDTLDIDLASSRGQRVYDRFELSAKPFRFSANPQGNPLILTLTHPTFFINGQFVADSGGVGELAGPGVWIDVPGRGRFVLTLDAHGDPRFLQAGSVQGNNIEFRAGPDRFRIECSAPVTVTANAAVYVYFTPDAAIQRPRFGSGGAPDPQR
jgi:hypothetical protein